MPSFALLGQALVSGLLIGGLYGLLSLGLTVSWGLLHLINIAYFGLAFLGAYLTFHLGTVYGVDPWFSALLIVLSPVRALAFVAVHQAVFGLYMGCAFAPNHKGMPTVPPGYKIDFLRRQVLTSRNVRGGWFTDLLLGGLNYQIEHHLFPNMPRANLRAAQRIVQHYCIRNKIAYAQTSLLGSYGIVLRHLHHLGAPLRRRESPQRIQ